MTPFLPPGRKYDRVTISNIADYVPLTRLLDMCEPLLNPSNRSSVIITEFHNWVQLTNLMDEANQRADSMPPGDNFRKKGLKDTNDPAIANSTAYQAFVEYQDHSAEFIEFLRAALMVSEISDAQNHRRTWTAVADCNELIARDFLRCQNRVFPAKRMLNCRRVTMLSGFERAVQWIAKPK